jgi:hypothetical protein
MCLDFSLALRPSCPLSYNSINPYRINESSPQRHSITYGRNVALVYPLLRRSMHKASGMIDCAESKHCYINSQNRMNYLKNKMV